MDIEKHLEKAAGEYAFQFKAFDSGMIEFSEEVTAACAANYCGMYGKHWTCPPGVGTISENREKYLRYNRAFVFTTLHNLGDSFDIEGMDRAREEHREAEAKILAGLNGKDYLLLGAGACNYCAVCTYPDAPCRFPDKAMTAVEAVGIHVVDLAQKLDVRYNNGMNTVTYFSVIFYNKT